MNKNLVHYFSIRDPKAVISLVNKLITKPSDSIILPFTDYPGPLIKEVLSRNFNSLTVCERNDGIRYLFHVSYN